MTAHGDEFTLCDTMSAELGKAVCVLYNCPQFSTLMRSEITNGLCDNTNYQAAVWNRCLKPKPHTPSPHMIMPGTFVMGPSPLHGCHNHKLLKAYWTPWSIAANLHIHVAQGVVGAGREICSVLTCACSTHCFNMDSSECDDEDSYSD